MSIQMSDTSDADEQAIRQLVQTWMTATQQGDVDKVMSLMSDDVVFLTPGQKVMDKTEFARIAQAQARPDGPKIEGHSEIQEIKVLGDWAFMWTRLRVSVTPPGQAEPSVRAGHTLTILHKQNGQWLLARDANLLAPVPSDPA